MSTKLIDIDEAQSRFSEVLSLVLSGTEVILTEHDKPLARVVPVAVNETPRVAGLNPGSIIVSEDFDDPLPDEFWLSGS